MTQAKKAEVAIFLPIYIALAFINLRAKLFVTMSWFNGTLASNHEQLLAFTYTNNEQSRLLQFSIPELLHKVLSLPIEDAYLVQRFLFVLLAFLCFHWYLRKWFKPMEAFAGVVFFAAVMPLTYFNHLQESAPLLLFTYILGLWAIRERNHIAFASILFIGGLNNETILSLTAVHLFYNIRRWKLKSIAQSCVSTALVSAPAWLTVAAIRYCTKDNPHLGDPFQLPQNLQGIQESLLTNPLHYFQSFYLYPLFIYGFFWLYAVLYVKKSDLFLQRASCMIPLFIAAHLITGVISEARQMLPIGFIIIPMAMLYVQHYLHEAKAK